MLVKRSVEIFLLQLIVGVLLKVFFHVFKATFKDKLVVLFGTLQRISSGQLLELFAQQILVDPFELTLT